RGFERRGPLRLAGRSAYSRESMAFYEISIHVPRPIEETFAFVSNFRNAAKWDPRTYSAEKTTPGPIGIGTVFVLRGGMIRKDGIPAPIPIPKARLASALSYDVAAP